MKLLIFAALALFAGCRNEHRTEAPASSQPPLPPDSASVAASDDSVLQATAIGGPAVITSRGDTLVNFGGGMMEGDGAKDYGIDHYAKNGIQYVRIAQTISRLPNGKAVWATRARLRLPSGTSAENLVLEGLCSTGGNYDPLIIAVTGAPVDSVRFQAIHAWRFDLTKQTLSEIPTAGVTCAHASGED